MTVVILETSGKIYLYIGNEIVVSWTEKFELFKNNAVECFSKIYNVFKRKEVNCVNKFGLVPSFKVGYLIGEFNSGKIKIIKKYFIFKGNVLNTTTCIRARFNTYNAKILISEDLADKIQADNSLLLTKIDKLALRSKTD